MFVHYNYYIVIQFLNARKCVVTR